MEMTIPRANLQRTGVYETNGPSDPPRIKWRFQTGNEICASPLIVDDWIYFKNNDGDFHALDAYTGKERWRFRSELPGGLSPAIDDDALYFPIRGVVHSLDRITGQERDEWAECYAAGTMSAVDGILYICNPGSLHAINLDTQKPKWRVRTGDSPIIHSPAFGEDSLYIGSFDDNLYAITRANGRMQWKFKTGRHVSMCPAVFGEAIYLSSEDCHVYALKIQNGEGIWKFSTGDIVTSPAVTNDVVCFGVWAGQMIALDRKSGQERWRFSTVGKVPSSPSIAQGIVYFGDGDFRKPGGRAYALDLQTGRELWRLETPNRVWSDPVIANGVLYMGSGDGCLYAIE